MDKTSLSSTTIVITGASSGIGKAAALRFAREESNLILAARSETHLRELSILCEDLGSKVLIVPTDVSDKMSVQNLFDSAISEFRSIDVWINNAGVGAIGEFTTTPLESHEQVIKTNLFGPLYGSYCVLPHFKEKKRGIIINTNSTGAYLGNPYTVSYSASKFGLRGLSEALRFELKDFKDIHVCELFAGFVDTPAFSHAANYTGKEISLDGPLLDPREMAEAMVKLVKKPRAAIHIGAQDRMGRLSHMITPELTGTIMNKIMKIHFGKAKDSPISDGSLFAPDIEDNSSIHGGFS